MRTTHPSSRCCRRCSTRGSTSRGSPTAGLRQLQEPEAEKLMDEAAAAPSQDAATAKWRELDAFSGRTLPTSQLHPELLLPAWFWCRELQPEPGGQHVPGPRRHQRQQVLSSDRCVGSERDRRNEVGGWTASPTGWLRISRPRFDTDYWKDEPRFGLTSTCTRTSSAGWLPGIVMILVMSLVTICCSSPTPPTRLAYTCGKNCTPELLEQNARRSATTSRPFPTGWTSQRESSSAVSSTRTRAEEDGAGDDRRVPAPASVTRRWRVDRCGTSSPRSSRSRFRWPSPPSSCG